MPWDAEGDVAKSNPRRLFIEAAEARQLASQYRTVHHHLISDARLALVEWPDLLKPQEWATYYDKEFLKNGLSREDRDRLQTTVAASREGRLIVRLVAHYVDAEARLGLPPRPADVGCLAHLDSLGIALADAYVGDLLNFDDSIAEDLARVLCQRLGELRDLTADSTHVANAVKMFEESIRNRGVELGRQMSWERLLSVLPDGASLKETYVTLVNSAAAQASANALSFRDAFVNEARNIAVDVLTQDTAADLSALYDKAESHSKQRKENEKKENEKKEKEFKERMAEMKDSADAFAFLVGVADEEFGPKAKKLIGASIKLFEATFKYEQNVGEFAGGVSTLNYIAAVVALVDAFTASPGDDPVYRMAKALLAKLDQIEKRIVALDARIRALTEYCQAFRTSTTVMLEGMREEMSRFQNVYVEAETSQVVRQIYEQRDEARLTTSDTARVESAIAVICSKTIYASTEPLHTHGGDVYGGLFQSTSQRILDGPNVESVPGLLVDGLLATRGMFPGLKPIVEAPDSDAVNLFDPTLPRIYATATASSALITSIGLRATRAILGVHPKHSPVGPHTSVEAYEALLRAHCWSSRTHANASVREYLRCGGMRVEIALSAFISDLLRVIKILVPTPSGVDDILFGIWPFHRMDEWNNEMLRQAQMYIRLRYATVSVLKTRPYQDPMVISFTCAVQAEGGYIPVVINLMQREPLSAPWSGSEAEISSFISHLFDQAVESRDANLFVVFDQEIRKYGAALEFVAARDLPNKRIYTGPTAGEKADPKYSALPQLKTKLRQRLADSIALVLSNEDYADILRSDISELRKALLQFLAVLKNAFPSLSTTELPERYRLLIEYCRDEFGLGSADATARLFDTAFAKLPLRPAPNPDVPDPALHLLLGPAMLVSLDPGLRLDRANPVNISLSWLWAGLDDLFAQLERASLSEMKEHRLQPPSVVREEWEYRVRRFATG